MTVVGLDDTDSRERGMCTTYVAARVAERIRASGGTVSDLRLVRCNPAVEHKTRGNAALAVECDLPADDVLALARREVDDDAIADDPRTNPGVVVAPHDFADAPDDVVRFAREAVRDHHDLADADALLDARGYDHAAWGNGRGRIGALAAIGAPRALDDWTWEYISYREAAVRGTPRDVDRDSLFDAADDHYPAAWDTVDRGEGQAVCVPNTPGPILYGIRGDDPDAVRDLAERIGSEPVERAVCFRTNQGTDAHLRDGDVGAVRDGRSYRVDGIVVAPPVTKQGGHVFFALGAPDGTEPGDDCLPCAAFEPTKRFRNRVRALRVGDRLTVCGEVTDGTLKLEKFAVRELDATTTRNPRCPDCGRSMASAGAGQGYRCRDCGTHRDEKETVTVDRDLEPGWYEVPPCARRHIAKPLVRGGFDAPVHPER